MGGTSMYRGGLPVPRMQSKVGSPRQGGAGSDRHYKKSKLRHSIKKSWTPWGHIWSQSVSGRETIPFPATAFLLCKEV